MRGTDRGIRQPCYAVLLEEQYAFHPETPTFPRSKSTRDCLDLGIPKYDNRRTESTLHRPVSCFLPTFHYYTSSDRALSRWVPRLKPAKGVIGSCSYPQIPGSGEGA